MIGPPLRGSGCGLLLGSELPGSGLDCVPRLFVADRPQVRRWSPAQPCQPVIRETRKSSDREIVLMRWGLIPHFDKSLADCKGISTINARAESVQKSTTWRAPFERRRCLVPADGFYEWKRLDPKTKQPCSFMMRDEASFAFAGLWDAWKRPDGGWLQSFSIVTTEANELMSGSHPHARDPAPAGLHALVEQGSDRQTAHRPAASFRVRRDEGLGL